MKHRIYILTIVALGFVLSANAQIIKSISRHSGVCDYGSKTKLHYSLVLERALKEYENGYVALILRIRSFDVSKVEYEGKIISNGHISVSKINDPIYLVFDDVWQNTVTNQTHQNTQQRGAYPRTTMQFDMSKTYWGIQPGAREKIGNPELKNLTVKIENLEIASIGSIQEVKPLIENAMLNKTSNGGETGNREKVPITKPPKPHTEEGMDMRRKKNHENPPQKNITKM